MKKRLLITSIVMMLVVAVALSTATYAWFTSNSYVTASTISLTAATNDADAIAIKWDTGTYGTAISTTKAYTDLAPMIPNEVTVHTTTLGGASHAIAFQTAQIYTDNSISKFKSVDTATAVAFASNSTDSPASKDLFFVQNSSTANIVTNLKITATLTPTLIACTTGELAVTGYTYYNSNDVEDVMGTQPSAGDVVTGKYKATTELVRIAVFTRDLTAAGTDDTTSDFILRGILANSASSTYFGTIANDDSQTAFAASTSPFTSNTATATAAATGFNICYDGGTAHTLAAQGVVAIKVIMWLDGEALNDNTQGAIASVALKVEAV